MDKNKNQTCPGMGENLTKDFWNKINHLVLFPKRTFYPSIVLAMKYE